MTDVVKLGNILLDECAKLEPGLAEVCGEDQTEMKVTFENTDFSVASSSQSAVFGLRVITKNRLGFVTTNSLEESELRKMAREAQMVAKLSPESPYHDIAPKQEPNDYSLFDDKLANASPKDLLRWTELLVSESKADSRIAIDRAEVSLVTKNKVIQNSNGVCETLKQTLCHWYIMGMAKDGNEVTSFDYDGNSSAAYGTIENLVKGTAREFRESVAACLGARHAVSYKGPVLFHPVAVATLLAGAITHNVNGRAQQDGMSRWAGQMGKPVASPLFNFTENPQDTTRPGTWFPFDREGVLTKKHEIIKNGILNFTAHSTFTAKRGQTSPTGNAVGNSRTLPTIGLHGLGVGAGQASLKELYNALKTGLVLKRFSGNMDPVSGQFSGIAKNSWWVENGERAYPLKEVMIAGNMFDLLTNVKMAGSEVIRQSGSFDSPYLLIDGVSVTSA